VASSSSAQSAGLTGSVNTRRHGAVAKWWQTQKGDLVKDAIIGFLVGVVLFLGACWWDARLQARQDALASRIADRQDDLARDLANQAEVLENTRFVRSIATSKEETPKPFASINLRGAELGGLNLGCSPRTLLGCADFRKSDLQEANLTTASFAGAGFWEADLRKANLTGTDFSAAIFKDANLDGAATVQSAGFQRALLIRTTFVQARLERAAFSNANLTDVKADEALLSYGDFRNAYLRRSRLTHADLRNAKFRDARMIQVDLTSADLRGADFRRADLATTVLTDVCFDYTTKWGSNRPPASSSC
jgi:uncharacterized protein YjbI with pentapeptide repeats